MSGPAMHPNDFVAAARRILQARGRSGRGGVFYEDERVVIVDREGNLDVTRKPIEDADRPYLAQGNPVTMVRGGRLIRHHGEARYLDGHLAAIDPGA